MEASPDKSTNRTGTNKSRINSLLSLRDEESQKQSDAISRNSSRFFSRNSASADRTTRRIMESVTGWTPKIFPAWDYRINSIPRMATIVAAAAMLIVFSSTITAVVMKRQSLVEITFILVAPEARSVSLAGDFNGWSLESDRLKKAGDGGQWQITVRLPKGRAYNYNFVLDGMQWIADPNATFKLDDGLGGTVSSLVL